MVLRQLKPGLNYHTGLKLVDAPIQFYGVLAEITPTEATIAVATEAPAILDEHTVSPGTATIAVATGPPTLPHVNPTTGTVTLSTEAPSLSVIGTKTVIPITADIQVVTEGAAVIQGEGLRRWPIILHYIRRWAYETEGYRPNVVYQRRYVIPMKPEFNLTVTAEATITIETEAPGVTAVDAGTTTVYPTTATIAVSAEIPGLWKINPNPAVIYKPFHMQFYEQVVWRPPVRLFGPKEVTGSSYLYRRRNDQVWYVPRRIRRSHLVPFDIFFSGDRTVFPGSATITVETEQGQFSFAGIVEPTSEATLTVATQSPNILLDDTSPLALEIIIMSIAAKRKRFKAVESNRQQRVEFPARIITSMVHARPVGVPQPISADIDIVTEAPTIVYIAATPVNPSTGTITVETEVPTLIEQGELQPISGTITVETEAPTLTRDIILSPSTATITVATDAPEIEEQGDTQPARATISVVTEAPTVQVGKNAVVAGEATITLLTEAPTVTSEIGFQIISPGAPARVELVTESPGISGIETVVFPGGDGVNTTELAILGGTPVIYLTQWVKENRATDDWTKESESTDSWEKAARAANDWRK